MSIPYRHKRALARIGTLLAVLFLIFVVTWLCWVVWLQRYVVYTSDGATLDFNHSSYGSYGKEANLQTILEGRAQVGSNIFTGAATDEFDTDAAMEELARHPAPLFLQQDMRDFELYGTVDATVCCLDSLNYLCGDGDLLACLKCVHLYLAPGGLLVFDVNSPYKFAHTYGNNAYILEDEDEDGFRCVMCPACGEKIYFDESMDPSDLICPACGKDVCGDDEDTEEV